MHLSFEKTEQNLTLAEPKKRVAAFLIDAFIILTVIALLDFYTISSDESTLFFKPEGILYILLGWLYYAGTETCNCMGTLGKYLLHIKVKSTHNTRLTFKRASIRYFSKPISVAVFLMRFILGLPSDVRRPFHDRITNALVVNE